jgi:isopenicillin-N N-acyltransferase-like protein
MVAAARKQHAEKHFPDGCIAALALPKATADGRLLHGQKDTGLAETPCSIYHDKRVREQLGPKRGKFTLEDLRLAFFDDWNPPWSVRRPSRPNNRGNLVATTAMIMRPGEGHLEACPMPPLNRRFTTYTLSPDRTAQQQAAE